MKEEKKTAFDVSKRMEELINATGPTKYGFSGITGINYSSLEKWLNESSPKIQVCSVQQFCREMGMPVSDFFRENLTAEDIFRIVISFWWKRMDDDQRKQALDWMNFMVTKKR